MDAMKALLERRSTRASNIGDEGPTSKELETLIRTAVSVPDHGGLKPFRFKVVQGQGRQRLSNLFVEAKKRNMPEVDAQELEKIASKPFRTPTVLIIYADVTLNHPKVPPIEQIITVGMAAQNIMTAAFVQNIGAVLLTGWFAHDPYIKQGLGLTQKDELVGFIHLGNIIEAKPLKRRPDIEKLWSYWPE